MVMALIAALTVATVQSLISSIFCPTSIGESEKCETQFDETFLRKNAPPFIDSISDPYLRLFPLNHSLPNTCDYWDDCSLLLEDVQKPTGAYCARPCAIKIRNNRPSTGDVRRGIIIAEFKPIQGSYCTFPSERTWQLSRYGMWIRTAETIIGIRREWRHRDLGDDYRRPAIWQVEYVLFFQRGFSKRS